MWRRITEDDLVATLSRREVDTFRRDFETDPVPTILEETAAWARGYIRSNGNVRMDPDERSLPSSCVSPALDCAAIKILKRLSVEPTEVRKDAWRDAVAYFEKIARGEINPESYGVDEAAATGGACAVVINNARDRVTSHKLEGL